jgi:hypothetical protein
MRFEACIQMHLLLQEENSVQAGSQDEMGGNVQSGGRMQGNAPGQPNTAARNNV